MGDSRQSVTDEEIIRLLKTGLRPVWTNSTLAEELDITRQTANRRLNQLEHESEKVESVKVGRATAYYVPGVEPLPAGDTIEERHRQSIIQAYTDRFVGLESAPWTAVHPNDGPAEAGDKVQLLVTGTPGNWGHMRAFTWDNRREKLPEGETDNDRTQALVSGQLYGRPTTPIEHIDYSAHGNDWDLEMHIGINEVETEKGIALLATGVKRHWIVPENDAVFLTDVEVDYISPQGEGQDLPVMEFDASGEEVHAEIVDEAENELSESEDGSDDGPGPYHGGGEPGL
jgi:hypothetical protein